MYEKQEVPDHVFIFPAHPYDLILFLLPGSKKRTATFKKSAGTMAIRSTNLPTDDLYLYRAGIPDITENL